jgi:hypothetical protein
MGLLPFTVRFHEHRLCQASAGGQGLALEVLAKMARGGAWVRASPLRRNLRLDPGGPASR